MPEQLGLLEFFAMEASDYLERLDAAVSRGDGPDRDEFVRLTRALRGSALMANQQAFATAASGLERLARAVHDKARPWDAATKQVAIRAVDDLKVLVRKVRNWTDADTQQAQRLAAALQSSLGPTPTPEAGRAPAAGERAFVAQQGSSLASALEQAAAALQQNPLARNPLQGIRRTMQPLRGIASLADHPPLPDLLEGIDRAVDELTRRREPAEEAAELFRAAARAISHAAQQIASSGKADPEAAQAGEFARRLGRLLGLDRSVVPIESLFYADEGPHVVHEGAPPALQSKLGSLELVSDGEHLRQAADALERAPSSVQRELRAHALVGTFHSLASAGGGALGSALRELSRLLRDAVARGLAVQDPKALARFVRDTGTVLTQATTEAEEALADRLRDVIAAIGTGSAPAPQAAATPAPVTVQRPSIPSAARPRATASAVAASPEATESLPGLVASYQRYDHLVATLGLGSPSLPELLAGSPAGAAVAVAAAAPAADVVPITALCYSGETALARALSLRDQVRAALAGAPPDDANVNDLIEEILDLVQLGTGHAG